jgi:hypothetical protein
MCTCKTAAEKSNVYVSGEKNNKIFPTSETMQGISTRVESKGRKYLAKKQLIKI